MRAARGGGRSEVRTGRLRAADPFELIRWLARSQTDPRKALAEVVLHSFPVPQGGPLLERLVSVLGVAERGLERG